MISNAVMNMPGSAVSAQKGSSGRPTGHADAAFAEALDRSEKATVSDGESAAEASRDKSPDIPADTRWRGAIGELHREPAKAKEADGNDADNAEMVKEAGEPAEVTLPSVAETSDPAVGEDGRGAEVKGKDDPDSDTGGTSAEPVVANQVSNAPMIAIAKASAAAGEDAAQNVADPDAKPSAKLGRPPKPAPTAEVRIEAAPVMPDNARIATAMPSSVAAGKPAEVAQAAAPARSPVTEPAPDRDNANAVVESKARIDGGKAVAPVVQDTAKAAAVPNTAAVRPAAERRVAETAPRMPTADERQQTPAPTAGKPVDPVAAQPKPAIAAETAAPASIIAGPQSQAGQQVADIVAQELEELSPSRLSLTATTSQGKIVKTMRLQLNPAELGAVNIRLQSVAGELRVTISAESENTARILNRDSDAIHSALRAAGVAGQDITVTVGRADHSQPQTSTPQNRDAAGQQTGNQDNRGSTSNESRQSYRESPPNSAARGSAFGHDDGDTGADRDRRLVI